MGSRLNRARRIRTIATKLGIRARFAGFWGSLMATRMPSPSRILSYWGPWLGAWARSTQTSSSSIREAMPSALRAGGSGSERCHIQARADGGDAGEQHPALSSATGSAKAECRTITTRASQERHIKAVMSDPDYARKRCSWGLVMG